MFYFCKFDVQSFVSSHALALKFCWQREDLYTTTGDWLVTEEFDGLSGNQLEDGETTWRDRCIVALSPLTYLVLDGN